MKSRSDHEMGVPFQGCPKSECRLTWVRMQWVPWTNCALCPLLAVSCGDTGLGLLTLTVSSPRMDFSYMRKHSTFMTWSRWMFLWEGSVSSSVLRTRKVPRRNAHMNTNSLRFRTSARRTCGFSPPHKPEARNKNTTYRFESRHPSRGEKRKENKAEFSSSPFDVEDDSGGSRWFGIRKGSQLQTELAYFRCYRAG
jgi:hypothetical protein